MTYNSCLLTDPNLHPPLGNYIFQSLVWIWLCLNCSTVQMRYLFLAESRFNHTPAFLAFFLLTVSLIFDTYCCLTAAKMEATEGERCGNKVLLSAKMEQKPQHKSLKCPSKSVIQDVRAIRTTSGVNRSMHVVNFPCLPLPLHGQWGSATEINWLCHDTILCKNTCPFTDIE